MPALLHFGVLFLCSLAWVFAAAWQSLCVNGGHYRLASANSFLIGALQIVVLSRLVGPSSTIADVITYCCGGAVGAPLAMWAKARWVRR